MHQPAVRGGRAVHPSLSYDGAEHAAARDLLLGRAGADPARLRDLRHTPGKEPDAPLSLASEPYAIGSFLNKGRLSQLLPAATMQLRPAGVVLTTVHVFLSSDA